MEGGYSTVLYFRHMFMIPIMLEKIEIHHRDKSMMFLAEQS